MENGAELQVIQTEALGFLAIAGDAKVQLTPAWSPPPAPTASLLSIASRKGLVAAAGPDAVYLSSTESARKAFSADKTGDTEFRAFEPQVKIPMPMRISHLAFTPDEQYLILSAEQGGGLAVYETPALLQGSSQAAFEISTSGESIRAMIPNPMPELAEFCAVVTTNGNLLIANLKEKSLVSGPNGPVIRNQVACGAWSTKGKQLVAGLSDGTVVQMTPDGTEKAQIPKPSAFGDVHVSSISWLENHVFLVIYTENSGESPASEYCIITRRAPPGQSPSFESRKLVDPVLPFGNEKAAHHTVLRLRDYPPNIQDMLIVASTAHDGLGLLTRSKAPLASDVPAEDITNVFTTTEFTDDSRRAEVPSDPIDYSPTYPIGVSLDLSSKESVYRPIPQDEEYEQSPGPLPALWALNYGGVLSAWWVVYNDAIREGKTYPGMAVAGMHLELSQLLRSGNLVG
ncbi:putative nuclear pore complex protein [Diaporthe ampelina]|uniref:Putative nuclear pore complex protein n=1 Tax=Diaporthe ampelina TaxID=1214573 RepID=A0A0G2FW42_9PEZI|nr:putative nuclear pore complex protein [Diaporthe ampelina]